jgi:uncharacterized protein (DUF952 family)
MQIIITTTDAFWEEAKAKGFYTRSTIDSSLEDVGFIHATLPNQTTDMLNRHFVNRDDVLLLQVEEKRIKPEVRFEKPLSGRDELFPHIYGPLNIDAVSTTIKPVKDATGHFIRPKELSAS